MSDAATEVLVIRFDAAARLEGQLLGALERAESGGAVRIVDVLMVARDADSGELQALRLRAGGAGGLVAGLTDFRLDPQRRRAASEQALGADQALAELGEALPPGTAVAAALVEHVWRRALDDAVRRTGGRAVGSRPVAPSDDLAREALALVRRDLATRAP